jgi:hypothetical protein
VAYEITIDESLYGTLAHLASLAALPTVPQCGAGFFGIMLSPSDPAPPFLSTSRKIGGPACGTA